MTQLFPETVVKEAIELAEHWQIQANAMMTEKEKTFQRRMQRLLADDSGKVILIRLLDQSLRSKNARRVADNVGRLFAHYGIPTFFSYAERFLTQAFIYVGRHVGFISIPLMIKLMRRETRHIIIPGENEPLSAYLMQRQQEKVHTNINHLGEAVLGEEEAKYRLTNYIADLENPEIECISVKISTIYSQILPIAHTHTVAVLKERLTRLYRAAAENRYTHADGKVTPKLVNLDMEEFRDVAITVDAFVQTLDEPEFRAFSAGIVLQAYLPESFSIQQTLTKWAQKRIDGGGAPIRMRIVKGANLEMENVIAVSNNWPLAPYDTKIDVDANFKRMLEYGMRSENIRAVHLGIASHNLFELALACHLARVRDVDAYVSIEMLEGMADHVRRAIQETCGDILLYAPVAEKSLFINAIGYLMRRLDENTAPENFLRYSGYLTVNSVEWKFLKQQFEASIDAVGTLREASYRLQNRLTDSRNDEAGTYHRGEFINEADTDWSLAVNRTWAEQIREKWQKDRSDSPFNIPVVVGGNEISDQRDCIDCTDPSQAGELSDEMVCLARSCLATADDIDIAVKTAVSDPDHWREMSLDMRHRVLTAVAVELRAARADLIGAAAAHSGKVFTETDAEVSEAIDFAEYYPFSLYRFERMPNIACSPKGVIAVISPWNFPVAIPCGGISAALAAGNTVIFKPASAAILPAWILCQCFWKAGVSKSVLQFLPCRADTAADHLIVHPDVKNIIFTGGTDTGRDILRRRPDVYLAAETGGKNATIVTAMADRDQAIAHVVHSAFSHSGQKCSATSLLILEKEVYTDLNFKKQLIDAVRSIAVGSVWAPENRMGPLISPPTNKLKHALTTLAPGESWALKPENINHNPHFWTPGIKWDVQRGSVTHLTEFFGPLLGVMCADDLSHAIQLANQTGYGLTAGLESLDAKEQTYWKKHIYAGNLYINRPTTGAVVLRQPFGGFGKSAIGAGRKAGGPNYVVQFCDIKDVAEPQREAVENSALVQILDAWCRKPDWGRFETFGSDMQKTRRAVNSYLFAWEQEFSKTTDFFHIPGQDNRIGYLPAGRMAVRVHAEDSLFDILARIAAAMICGCEYIVSIPLILESLPVEFLLSRHGMEMVGKDKIFRQADDALIEMMPDLHAIRYAAPNRVPDTVLAAAAHAGLYISRTPVVMEGRIELLRYLKEQSISNTYHRYGNLGEREMRTLS